MTIMNEPPAESVRLDHRKAKALDLRRNMLVHAAGKGQGYLGQGFALADFLAALYFHELRYDPGNPHWEERDRFYLSTGHYSPTSGFRNLPPISSAPSPTSRSPRPTCATSSGRCRAKK